MSIEDNYNLMLTTEREEQINKEKASWEYMHVMRITKYKYKYSHYFLHVNMLRVVSRHYLPPDTRNL